MKRVFHIGIVMAVAVHMVFGCCFHHAHASGPRIDPLISVNAACPHEQHGHQHEKQPCNHGGDHQQCDEGTCTFFRTDSSGSDGSSSRGLQGLPLISCVPLLLALGEIDTVDWAPSRFGAPIPLHLLNQALLL